MGTPRATTLIVDQLGGRINNPTQTNPYQAGTHMSAGLHQLIYSTLWEINTATGEQFPALAAEMPEALNDDFTSFRITLRDNLRWSDGEPITTADMAFNIDMILNTPEFPYSGFLSQVIDNYEVVDDLTIILNLKRSEPRLAYTLGVHIWGDNFRMVPKHIWENEDPATFQNYPPVASGPYTMTDVDPNGNWFLYTKREDWQHTDVGQIFGEPGPEYVLFRFYGTEERRIIAGIQNQLDIFTDISPEAWDILREGNPNARAWHQNFPWANFDDPCERGIVFSNTQEPWDNQNVRWAMALATDIKSVGLATFAGILRVSPLAVPPVQVIHDAFHKPMRDCRFVCRLLRYANRRLRRAGGRFSWRHPGPRHYPDGRRVHRGAVLTHSYLNVVTAAGARIPASDQHHISPLQLALARPPDALDRAKHARTPVRKHSALLRLEHDSNSGGRDRSPYLQLGDGEFRQHGLGGHRHRVRSGGDRSVQPGRSDAGHYDLLGAAASGGAGTPLVVDWIARRRHHRLVHLPIPDIDRHIQSLGRTTGARRCLGCAT